MMYKWVEYTPKWVWGSPPVPPRPFTQASSVTLGLEQKGHLLPTPSTPQQGQTVVWGRQRGSRQEGDPHVRGWSLFSVLPRDPGHRHNLTQLHRIPKCPQSIYRHTAQMHQLKGTHPNKQSLTFGGHTPQETSNEPQHNIWSIPGPGRTPSHQRHMHIQV